VTSFVTTAAWSGPCARSTGLHKSDRLSGHKPRSLDEEPHSGGATPVVLRGNLLGRRPLRCQECPGRCGDVATAAKDDQLIPSVPGHQKMWVPTYKISHCCRGPVMAWGPPLEGGCHRPGLSVGSSEAVVVGIVRGSRCCWRRHKGRSKSPWRGRTATRSLEGRGASSEGGGPHLAEKAHSQS
jgi:hypothetical protein